MKHETSLSLHLFSHDLNTKQAKQSFDFFTFPYVLISSAENKFKVCQLFKNASGQNFLLKMLCKGKIKTTSNKINPGKSVAIQEAQKILLLLVGQENTFTTILSGEYLTTLLNAAVKSKNNSRHV
eukprot:UN02547